MVFSGIFSYGDTDIVIIDINTNPDDWINEVKIERFCNNGNMSKEVFFDRIKFNKFLLYGRYEFNLFKTFEYLVKKEKENNV